MRVKNSFIVKIFCVISLCLSSLASASVKVVQTDSFADVTKKVDTLVKQYGADQVLIVVDIDNTLLTSTTDLGSDVWYQWQRGSFDVKPRPDQKVQCLFEDSIGLLYELVPMDLTEPRLPEVVKNWQQSLTVFALTSRSPKYRPATERELLRNKLDLSVNPLPFGEQKVPVYRTVEGREISYMEGVMMTSGLHKGKMLQHILDKAKANFKAIVFVDDTVKNVKALKETISDKATEMTVFHYTRIEHQRMKKNGTVLTQQQADAMAKQWDDLNNTLNSLFPARDQGVCLGN